MKIDTQCGRLKPFKRCSWLPSAQQLSALARQAMLRFLVVRSQRRAAPITLFLHPSHLTPHPSPLTPHPK